MLDFRQWKGIFPQSVKTGPKDHAASYSKGSDRYLFSCKTAEVRHFANRLPAWSLAKPMGNFTLPFPDSQHNLIFRHGVIIIIIIIIIINIKDWTL